MKTLYHCSLCLGLAFNLQLNAQISWTDNFNDGDLQSPVKWLGDTQAFITNTNLQLQLNATNAASPAYLTCQSSVIDQAVWEFYIKLDFSPSASNYAEVYIVANHQDPISSSQAYFLRIGGISGSSDDVSLYVKNNNLERKLIDGVDGLAGGPNPEMMIKVQKDSNHLWGLWIDDALNGNYQLQGNAYDSSIRKSSYFSFLANYTSTRADKFYWDSVSVSGFPFQDLEPVEVRSLSAIDSTKLLLSLSEIPETSSAIDPFNYRIIENGSRPVQITFDHTDSSQLYLEFASSFESGKNYFLEVSRLMDRSANQMQTDSLSFTFFRFDSANFGDVRITEIMADPIPSNGLPEVEYLELFNTTSSYFELTNWRISDLSSEGEFPSHILGPKQYVLLCASADTALLSTHGSIIGLPDFPSLNNSEDKLWLRDSNGRLIDHLTYRSSWHENEIKRNGGWSLEMINPFQNCSGEDNFSSSNDFLGGTPAKQNSLYNDQLDTIPPVIDELRLISAFQIIVEFNEILDTSAFDQFDFQLQSQALLDSITLGIDGRSISIELTQALDSGRWQSLRCIGLSDCEGNLADTLIAEFILPFVPQRKEVVLNEILFNPKSGGVDFVELYNSTDKVIGLDGIWVSNSEDTGSWRQLEAKGWLIQPNEIIVFSEDLDRLNAFHENVNINRLIETDLPAFPNESGDLYIWNQDKVLVEHFSYHEDMHFQLLNSFEGVSLERLSYKGESEAENFFSASSLADFATPTRANSQKWPSSSNAMIGLREKIFSPDNDGYQDLLFLDYQFEKTGFVAKVEILDAEGRRVRQLINNQLMETAGSLRWDGINDQGSKVQFGIYILIFEAFHPSGEVVFKKLPLAVAGMLD